MTLSQITKIRGPGIHTTSNIVSHNINSSGIITAVAFKGPFTGSSNIQSGILTATKIDLNGDIDVDGHTNLDNVNVAGVATFASAVNTGALTATTGTFSGNVSIGGTLTYEDVTNIDSVGLVTARTGVVSPYADIDDWIDVGNNIQLGNAGVATATLFNATTGVFAPYADIDDWIDVGNNIQLGNAGVITATDFKAPDGNGNGFYVGNSDDLHLFHNGADSYVENDTGNLTLTNKNNNNIIFKTTNSETERVRITSTGYVGINTSSPQYPLHVAGHTTDASPDGIGVLMGLQHNHALIHLNAESDLGCIIDFSTPNTDRRGGILYYHSNNSTVANRDAMQFHTAGSERLRIDSSGHITPGAAGTQDLGSTSKEFRHIYHGDSGKAFFGLDQDLSVYHNNSHAFINNSTGNLNLQTSGNVWIENQGGTKVWIKALANGSVELYDNNIKTFQTDANGIRVLGPDGGVGNIELFADRGDDNADKWRFQTSATASELSIQNYVNGSWETSIKSTGNSHTELYCANEKMFQTNGDGAEFFDGDNNFNLYFTCAGTRRGYIFVDATNGGKMSFMDPQNHTLLSGTKNSSVDLYHDNTLRLQTSSTGISVTGEVAATQDYPIIKPSLNLNFAATKSLDPRIKYYRHGPASYVDQTGRVVLVGENTPRFDHDPATRECKGLLVEEAKTNYAIHSTTLLNSAYNYLNSSKVGYSATAPDGTNNATLIYPSSSGNGRGIEDTYTLPSTGKWTTSVYVKSAGVSWVTLYGVNGGTRGWFNLSTGAKGGNTGGALDYDIIDAGNGWYRIWVTYNLTSTGGTEYFYVYMGDADNSTTITANGTNGIYMWGLQVEKSDFPTSYIPTYDQIQTRGADNPFMDAIGDSFYSQDEGTAIIEYNYNEDSDGAHSLFTFSGKELDPDSSNPRQWLRINKTAGTARSIRYSLTTDAGSTSDDSSAVATPGQWDKFAFAYTAGDQDLYLNGSSINDLARTPPTNCYRLSFGNVGWDLGTETVMLEGHIKRFMYYPKKLPNSQLATITS